MTISQPCRPLPITTALMLGVVTLLLVGCGSDEAEEKKEEEQRLQEAQAIGHGLALAKRLANLPGKFVGGVSGFIVEASSYSAFFAMSALTVVPTLLLLAWLWRRIREEGDPRIEPEALTEEGRAAQAG